MTNDLKIMTKFVHMNVSQGCHKVDYFTVKLYLKKDKGYSQSFNKTRNLFTKLNFTKLPYLTFKVKLRIVKSLSLYYVRNHTKFG